MTIQVDYLSSNRRLSVVIVKFSRCTTKRFRESICKYSLIHASTNYNRKYTNCSMLIKLLPYKTFQILYIDVRVFKLRRNNISIKHRSNNTRVEQIILMQLLHRTYALPVINIFLIDL